LRKMKLPKAGNLCIKWELFRIKSGELEKMLRRHQCDLIFENLADFSKIL
jgi:hypothetical protein